MQIEAEQHAPEWDEELVEREFPPVEAVLYLNTGSSGRKPQRVLAALKEGWEWLNVNPTTATFLDTTPCESARSALSRLLGVPEQWLILTQNSTQGLQLIMSSFLISEGDELVITNHEHGSVRVLARYLKETRGIVVHTYDVDPMQGSETLCRGLLDLVNEKTRLVLVSEISSYSGWRPDLSSLLSSLEEAGVPVLIDGAHAPGQVVARPARYPLWVSSTHKWLGGPSGTGVAMVQPHLVPHLKPVFIGDSYYERLEAEANDLRRFESQGTTDVVRFKGLAAACSLQFELGEAKILARSFALAQYLRQKLDHLRPVYRTPLVEEPAPRSGGGSGDDSIGHDFRTAMVTFHFEPSRLAVDDLREALWQRHRIWVQPDFAGQVAGHGMRISCHYSLNESDIDRFIEALKTLLK